MQDSAQPTSSVLRLPKLTRPQTLAYRALKRGNTVVLPWGRGTGKSYFVRLCWWLLVAEWDGKTRPGAMAPGVRIVLLMPTLEQARKVHLSLTIGELEGTWKFLGGTFNKSTFRIEFPGGSWIQWVTAEKARFIRGLRCDVICIDECDDVSLETFTAIATPWISEGHSLKIMLLSGTPTRGRYGLLYTKYQQSKTDHDVIGIHATYHDVHPSIVSPETVFKARRDSTPALFEREWEANFDSAEGLVYPMFDEGFHVREPDSRVVWNEYLVGVDHGYEDPAVFLLIGVAGSGRDAICHVLYEHFATKKVAEELAKQVPVIIGKTRGKRARWYCDPSQPAMIETYRRAGATIAEADNSIEDGVSCVANLLAVRKTDDGREYSRLYVSPQCKNLIREFGLYRRKRDPRNADRILDDIQDRDNHGQDALRYALFSRFGGPSRERIESGAG